MWNFVGRPGTAALAVAAVAALAACGGSSSTTGATPRPTTTATQGAKVRWPCLRALGARETTARGGLPVAIVGRGRRAVALANQSDEDACGWRRLVPVLRRDGFRVALFDDTGSAPDDLQAVARWLRRSGADAVGLVGASEGAKAAIMVGSRMRPPVAAVVSLSAEDALQGVPIAPFARRLAPPVLFAAATDDPYAAADTARAFHRRSRSSQKRLLIVGGDAHGTALLADPKVLAAVSGFLRRHVR